MTPYTARRPALVLAAGVTLVCLAAVVPAGIAGQPVPRWAWMVWLGVFVVALDLFRRSGLSLRTSLHRVLWLLPVVAMFAVPAAWLAPSPDRLQVAAALGCRALAAASAAAAAATWLGPAGLGRAARQLGLPERLVDVLEAMLVSLTLVVWQAHAMLRAREARRPDHGAWSHMVATPTETVLGFGRLVAALLLRSLERAEALERARRARGDPA